MIFADTSYFIGLLNPDDEWHDTALLATAVLDEPLITSEWLLIELANSMREPNCRVRCSKFIRDLRADGMRVAPATSEWFERGLALFERRTDKAWSLTDCISFLVMDDENLTEALTTDHHFTQAGFRALMRGDE